MSRSLHILLFAHHEVGVAALRGLLGAGHQVDFCYTHGARAGDWFASVSSVCDEAGIACSDKPAESWEAERFRPSRPDLIVCAGYRRRIEMPFLSLPQHGAINLHLGPLPQYRGVMPIRWGILHRASAWAVTVHGMTHNYSDGPILARRHVALRPEDNAYDLMTRSTQAGAEALLQAVDDIAQEQSHATPQDLRDVRFFDTLIPHHGEIDWHQPAVDLAAFVRAMDLGRFNSEDRYTHLLPPAQAEIEGQRLGIWRAHAGGTMSSYSPGTITRTEGQVWVQTGRGHLVVECVLTPDGRDYPADEYLSKHGLGVGDRFDTRAAWQTTASKFTHAA